MEGDGITHGQLADLRDIFTLGEVLSHRVILMTISNGGGESERDGDGRGRRKASSRCQYIALFATELRV